MRSSVGLCIDASVFPTNALFAMQQQELKGGGKPSINRNRPTISIRRTC